MNVKEENICRLCLKVAVNNFEIIDEITREIFDVLSLKVNLDLSKDPIICKDCAEVAEKCFNFKSTCIDTEELVFSHAIDKKSAMFELRDVCKDRKIIETVDDDFLCRFCLNYLSGSNFVLLDTLMNDITFGEMLPRLMPEMDFDIIKNPIICTTCKQDLESYIKFMEICLDVEEKITKYLQNEGTPSWAQVKLSEILRFLFKNILELDYTQTLVIKQEVLLEDIDEEHSEGYDGELIKAEEEIDIKDEDVNFNETTCETPSEFVNKCDTRFNMISSKTGMGKAYRMKYKGEDDKRIQMLSTENILGAHILKCGICTYETKYKGWFKRHMSLHKLIREVKMYNCLMCTYVTKHKYSLKKHMLIHKDITEVETYNCSICTYKTKRKGDLTIHMLIHKDITEVKTYKCSVCTYQAKQMSSMKTHLLIHKDITEVEMFKCSMCTYKTKFKSDLKKHSVIHEDITEVEMHKCSICTYQAIRKCTLKRHMLIHRDNTEVKMYKCAMCTFETKFKSRLITHVLIHRDITKVKMYKCSMCIFQTKYKGDIKRHMIVHKDITEVEMYKCLMCSFETRHKCSLRSHMLTHKDVTEIKMYKCSMCTYQAKLKGTLKNHIMSMHQRHCRGGNVYKCTKNSYKINRGGP